MSEGKIEYWVNGEYKGIAFQNITQTVYPAAYLFRERDRVVLRSKRSENVKKK